MHADSARGISDFVARGDGSPVRGLLGRRTRLVLLAAFLVVTLPVTPLLVAMFPVLQPLLAVHLAVHAVPLFITALIDSAVLDGGEVTPELIPLWSALTGVMLWPLPALSFFPALWSSPGWRKAMLAYSLATVAATIGAAYWVFTHLGVFF